MMELPQRPGWITAGSRTFFTRRLGSKSELLVIQSNDFAS